LPSGRTWSGISQARRRPNMGDCRCGHPAEDHVTGLCLSTLECLCNGYDEEILPDVSDEYQEEDNP